MAEGTFDDITARLDEIITTVRSKDTSLERSLDLFDEAIELGSRAVDMVDSFELSPREAEMLDEREVDAQGAVDEGASEGDVSSDEADAVAQAGQGAEDSAAEQQA